jgi:DNA-binding PadR family transcriptional regulator
MELKKGAYLVLGMIATGCRSGYEISKTAEITSRFFWAAGDGQIYPQLRRLAADGLIRGRSEARGEREKNVYELTDEGHAALREWLISPEPPMWELRDEGLLKLFFADELTTEELRARVAVLRDSHERALERLREIEPHVRQRPGARLTHDHGVALHQAAVRWCEGIDAELAEAGPAAPAARTLADIFTPG